jgi:hypothetical protein
VEALRRGTRRRFSQRENRYHEGFRQRRNSSDVHRTN